MPTPTPTFRPGDRVAYSAAWLRSIGVHTGSLPAARGSVIDVQPLGDRQLVTVAWFEPCGHTKVIADNLAHVGPNSRFCQC